MSSKLDFKTTGNLSNSMYTCYACGLVHKDVEVEGIWYCPNPLCTMCGSEWFKRRLKSYKEIGSQYSVDIDELVEEGLAYLETIDDQVIKNAAHEFLKTSKFYEEYRINQKR